MIVAIWLLLFGDLPLLGFWAALIGAQLGLAAAVALISAAEIARLKPIRSPRRKCWLEDSCVGLLAGCAFTGYSLAFAYLRTHGPSRTLLLGVAGGITLVAVAAFSRPRKTPPTE